MSAVNEFASQMDAVWEKNKAKIVRDLGSDDFYDYNGDDFFSWYRTPDKADLSNDELIEDHIGIRCDEFISDFHNHAEEDGNKLIVYRCLSVDDQDEFIFHIANGEPAEGYDGLGIFWSWNKDKAGCHWGSGSSGQGSGDVVVEALVNVHDIDAYATLVLNLNPSLGEDEAEIRIKAGAKLEVLGVHTSDNEYISPLDEGFKPIPMHANYPTVSAIMAAVEPGKYPALNRLLKKI